MRLLHRHSLYYWFQKWPHSLFENNTGQTDLRTDGRTNRQTDGWTRPPTDMRLRILKPRRPNHFYSSFSMICGVLLKTIMGVIDWWVTCKTFPTTNHAAAPYWFTTGRVKGQEEEEEKEEEEEEDTGRKNTTFPVKGSLSKTPETCSMQEQAHFWNRTAG